LRGCFVMLSNSDHALTRELYRDYEKNIVIVRAKRMINSVGSKRGTINEVVVTNYDTPKIKTSNGFSSY
jgi:DNA adenine methylase